MKIYEKDYLEFRPYSYRVYEDMYAKRSLNIYYEPWNRDREYSIFTIFYGGIYSGDLIFPMSIKESDVLNISKSMKSEFVQYVKKAECEEVYFDFPSTLETWKDIYGLGSVGHKRALQSNVIEAINDFLRYGSEDVELVGEIVEYLKEYSSKKCRCVFG